MPAKNKILALFLLLLLALSLRIFVPFLQQTYFKHDKFIINGERLFGQYKSDEIVYNFTAKSLLEKKGFSLNVSEALDAEKDVYTEKMLGFLKETYTLRGKQNANDPRYWHHNLIPPMYSAFLAFMYYLFGVNTLAYFIPQVFLGAITCILVYFLAKTLFNEKVAMLSGLAVALCPELILWSYMIRPETLYMFLLVLGFLLIIAGNLREKYCFIVGGGIIIGLACLTRITLLPFIPLLVLWQFWYAQNGKKWKLFATLFLLILLVLLPWIIRNYVVFNEFTFFTHEVSVLLVDNVALEKFKNTQVSLGYLAQFYTYLLSNPQDYFLNCFHRLVSYLSPFTEGMDKIAKIYKTIFWLLIFPVGFVGMTHLIIKRTWEASSLLMIFIVYYIAVHAASCVDIGLVYRFPIIPFMCIFAAYAYLRKPGGSG